MTKPIEFVKVDAKDGRPATDYPTRHGPADPIPGIDTLWFERGQPARYYGLAPNDADVTAPGVLREIPQAEWEAMLANRAASEATEAKRRIADARKQVEIEGVTLNGIRYSGSPENRTAVKEAIEMASYSSITEIKRFKDSDGVFHDNVAISDIEQALVAIGQNRINLIDTEGDLSAEIDTALASNDLRAIRAVKWS